MGTKQCHRCGEHRKITEFFEAQGYPRNVCRECYNERRRLNRKPRTKVQKAYDAPPPKPKGALLPPYVVPLNERPVYVPPRWGR